jgi:hypothetical protein
VLTYHKKARECGSPEPFKIDSSLAQAELKRMKEVSRPQVGIKRTKVNKVTFKASKSENSFFFSSCDCDRSS